MSHEKVIELQNWMKLHQWVGSGGEAKTVIQAGQVCVNGEVETRRRRKLRPGDQIKFGEQQGTVSTALT